MCCQLQLLSTAQYMMNSIACHCLLLYLLLIWQAARNYLIGVHNNWVSDTQCYVCYKRRQ